MHFKWAPYSRQINNNGAAADDDDKIMKRILRSLSCFRVFEGDPLKITSLHEVGCHEKILHEALHLVRLRKVRTLYSIPSTFQFYEKSIHLECKTHYDFAASIRRKVSEAHSSRDR